MSRGRASSRNSTTRTTTEPEEHDEHDEPDTHDEHDHMNPGPSRSSRTLRPSRTRPFVALTAQGSSRSSPIVARGEERGPHSGSSRALLDPLACACKLLKSGRAGVLWEEGESFLKQL